MTHLTKNILEDSEIRFYRVDNHMEETTWFASLLWREAFEKALNILKSDMKSNPCLDIQDLEDYCDCYLFSSSWIFYA